MSELIGRQASITFSGITTVANGEVVGADFGKRRIHTVTRWDDIGDRLSTDQSTGRFRIRCRLEAGSIPSLSYVQAGTAAVLTVSVDASRKYNITNCIVIGQKYGADSGPGAKPQYVDYDLAQTQDEPRTEAAVAS